MRYLRDESTQLLEEAYLKAERRAAEYMRRGYWRAAIRWFDTAAALFTALADVGWVPDEDRADA